VDFNTVDILGVNVACTGMAELLSIVGDWARVSDRPGPQPFPRTVLYANAHSLNVACADPAYHAILRGADLVYADGAGVVLAGRLLGARSAHGSAHGATRGMAKATGGDWIGPFCAQAAGHGWRIYILAGAPGIAAAARTRLQGQWPGINIVGACDGYFGPAAEAQVIADIAAAAPDILFVGMGTPRQEKWIAAHRGELPARVCWAVGALFDYVAGVEKRVPGWMNALGFEWLWRLLVNPLGKWRRYVLGNPLFLYRVLRQAARRRLTIGD
jgi:N-acetylglucosaminyldiphosphoundecaprenol N-acetyl-beta-D-mannosaminyltransferase